MGRHQKPYDVQVLEGTARNDRPRREAIPQTMEVSIPDPPEHLNAKAQSLWIKTCTVLLAENRLSAGMLSMLEVYCAEMDNYWHYARKVRKDPIVVYRDEAGNQIKVVSTPLAEERDKAFNKAFNIAKEYGFTPASRTKIKADGPSVKPVTKLEGLMSKRK